jgi:hypothetical protein
MSMLGLLLSFVLVGIAISENNHGKIFLVFCLLASLATLVSTVFASRLLLVEIIKECHRNHIQRFKNIVL